NSVFSITEDKHGNLWFGTIGGGVSRYDPSAKLGTGSESFMNFTTTQGLTNNSVFSITEDKNGNLWFGTEGGGVSRYDGESFVNFSTTQGLANNIVFSITEDKNGNLWFGTAGGGVSRYDGKSFMNFTTAQGLANNSVFSITEDKNGILWFGTYGGGVSRYDPSAKLRTGSGSFMNFTTAQGLANNIVRSITEDKNGNLWFGTVGGGVSRYDGKSFMSFTTAQGLANNSVFSITEDKNGILWFGTAGGGVSRYDPSAKLRTGSESFMNFTTAQGLANNIVCNITEDKNGNLWFSTYGGGISRYDGKSFLNFTTAQGLPDNSVTQIVITKEQNIAIGTNLGVAMLTSFTPKLKGKTPQSSLPAQNNLTNEELINYTPVIEIYNSATGYPVKDVNTGQNCMFADSKGIIWAGTGSDKTSLVRFDYAALNKNNKPPAVFIQAVKINNENISWYNLDRDKLQIGNQKPDSGSTPANITEEVSTFGKIFSDAERDNMKLKFGSIQFDSITEFYPLPENLILPYEHNNVTFDFAAIEPARPYMVNYQYMLEGYDKEWSPVLKKNSATFGNIREGTYTFKLKAQSPFGIWSEPVEYKFKVLPPWWRTWWMYTIYVLVFVSGIWSFIKWREKNLKREKEILETKVEQRTEQLRKANVEITEQKKVVEEKNKDITDSINYALRIQKAFLPEKEEIYSSFPQSFILFKPKDIVSGDFYFFHKNNESVFVATADCTGHGVPGAFMSMVGYERLTDAVQQSNNVSEILSLLNIGVKQSLHQSDKDESTRDGMDIALCSVDTVNRIVKYAGANRPIWIIRNGQVTVEEIKATKKAIGGLTEDSQYFDTHEIKLEQGDTFYISTDGYADTFSGQDNKKLTTKRFKALLLSIQDKSLKEQEAHLDRFIEDWKAGAEQIDDILVIGVRM
ncbi:MAG: two-component regulator propeller domain-containing protein, partial [Bacteroidota bacterium]